MLDRRAFLTAAGGLLATAGFSAEPPRPKGVPLSQEPLDFDYDALEPFISRECLQHHYEVYHAQCVAGLQEALAKVNLHVANVVSLMPSMHRLPEPPAAAVERRSLLSFSRGRSGGLPQDVVQEIRQFGGAHINHTAFWRFLSPPGRGPAGPKPKVLQALQNDFGGFDDFKRAFTDAALEHFGSGWAWLSYRDDGRLFISTTNNEDNPLMNDFVAWQEQGRPILCLDLWEHAYCHRYHENRRKYVAAWWKYINWERVEWAYNVVTASS
jgi:Fe-Mn family superoxide dismutase